MRELEKAVKALSPEARAGLARVLCSFAWMGSRAFQEVDALSSRLARGEAITPQLLAWFVWWHPYKVAAAEKERRRLLAEKAKAR